MASIYLFNLKSRRCIEIAHREIRSEDIDHLKTLLPHNLEGLEFDCPIDKFEEATIRELRVESKDRRVGEYLQGIAKKLEKLKHPMGALRFYELAFRILGEAALLIHQARCLSQLGYLEQSENLIKRSLTINPQLVEAYFLLGKHRMGQSDYDQAFQYFEKAKQCLPEESAEDNWSPLLNPYLEFASIYYDRDRLFTRDLSPERCIEEIQKLHQRSQGLYGRISQSPESELQGMLFFLETQEKIFEKWLEEMQRA